MAGPSTPAPDTGTQIARGTLVLVGILGTLLVAGYIVLAALGRDTAGYALFLASPAATAIVGAIISRRVSHVTTAVTETQAETTATVTEHISTISDHLLEQDERLDEIVKKTDLDAWFGQARIDERRRRGYD